MFAGDEIEVDIVVDGVFEGEDGSIVSRIPNFVDFRAGMVLVLVPYGSGHLDVFNLRLTVQGVE